VRAFARILRKTLARAALPLAAAGVVAIGIRLVGAERAMAERAARARLESRLRFAAGQLVLAGGAAIRTAERAEAPVAVVDPDGAFRKPPGPRRIPRLPPPRGEDPEGGFYLAAGERAEAVEGDPVRAAGLYRAAARGGRATTVRLHALFRLAAVERRRGRAGEARATEREFLSTLPGERRDTLEALVVRARLDPDDDLRRDLLRAVGGPDEVVAIGLLRDAGLFDARALEARRRELGTIREFRALLERGDRGARLDRGRVGGWTRNGAGEVRYGIAPMPTLGPEVRVPAPGATEEGAIADRTTVGEPFADLRIAAVADRAAVAAEARRGMLLVGAALVLLLAGGGAVVALTIRAARRESAAARERAAFVTRVGHDLRTPLAVIRMYAETLADGRVEDSEQAREFAGIAAREAERLTRTVGDALDLTRLAGEDRPVRERLDLAGLVRETVAAHEPLAARAGLRVCVAADGTVPVRGDPAALRGAVGNLIENAVRHAAEGDGLDVSCRPRAGRAEVVVADRGPGFPAELGDRILDRFVRGPRATGSGAGLGLAVVREVAAAHGGEVRLGRREGGGAEATLSLPAEEEA